jgi:hypothetical protein
VEEHASRVTPSPSTSGTRAKSASPLRVLLPALARPRLYLPMLRAAWRFRRRAWYRTWPFLPLPSADYLAWRLHTAYGDERAMPPLDQLERYLAWSERMRNDA